VDRVIESNAPSLPRPGGDGCCPSGLALVVPGVSAAAPLSRAACLALVRAVLDGGADAWRLASAHPGVAEWLGEAAVEPLRPAGAGGPRGRAGDGRGAAGVASLPRLRQSLVPVATLPGGSLAAEALVLLDAVRRAAEHEALATRFAAAVHEARTEALRELAYGAGHEINNPLANIAARAQALLVDEQDAERRRRLATIVDQAFRARDMIGGLMLYARPPKPQPRRTAVDAILRPVVESVSARTRPGGVRLEYRPPEPGLHLDVDAAQVGEAVRALVVNGCEAVADAGRVAIEAGRRDGGDPGWCDIVVTDDGRGMDADTLRRAGDPFFSGREAGRGIGLGLPKARRLIESNGGGLTLWSAPGRGTRAVVSLPLAAAADATGTGPIPCSPAGKVPPDCPV